MGRSALIVTTLVLGVSALAGACARRRSEAAEPFVLELIRPKYAEGVYLNEPLLFDFSADLDPASVTAASVSIESAAGLSARGRRSLLGRRIRFDPDPVLARDLSDGGYLPGEEYVVTLRGFPHVDGLRAADGRPLERTVRWRFTTAAPSEPRVGFVFADDTPERAAPLRVDNARRSENGVFVLARDEPIRLACEEPLDPSTLEEADFTLVARPLPEVRERPANIELRGRFARNDEARRGSSAGARIELLPRTDFGALDRASLRGTYYELVAPNLRLTDFGGNPVGPPTAELWGRSRPLFHLLAEGTLVGGGSAADVRAAGDVREVRESFGDDRGALPVAVVGMDGSAAWNGDGVVTIRFPAAAGEGDAGSVALQGDWPPASAGERRDLHAVRLRVESGERLTLPSAGGAVVLRAQGALEIDGRLERAGEAAAGLAFDSPERARLSDWLATALAADTTLTALVAGGDLTVRGSIECATPLLLAAGGRVRLLGPVRAPEIWIAGEGGGSLSAGFRKAPVILDPPGHNPLREPLRFGVISQAHPAQDLPARWLSAGLVAKEEGGRIQTHYFAAAAADLSAASFDPASVELLPTPALMREEGPIRFLIVLELLPAGYGGREEFRPPFVDEIVLSYQGE